MEDMKLIEKVVVVPEKPTERRRISLSNIDSTLVVYLESVSFYTSDNKVTFSEAWNSLYRALGPLLTAYDFFAGRLVPSLEDDCRFEIDCNGAGIVFAGAKTDTLLSQLGDISAPKPEFKQLVSFLNDENEDEMDMKDKPLLYIHEDEMDMKDKPLLYIQLTQFGCGAIALANKYNHCVLDGVAVREFELNMAALTRGEGLVFSPNPDRSIFKARKPPVVNHPHYEYYQPSERDDLFTVPGTRGINRSIPIEDTRHIHMPPESLARLKKAALKDGQLQNCSTFQALAAKIWKARTLALKMDDDETSTMLFPVDVRKIIVPPAPEGFAGNAIIPGFVRTTVKDLKDKEDSYIVRKVQEGVERLNDEYVRSSIDWLEVYKGVPCTQNSFSLVSWFRLGLEKHVFSWGKIAITTPAVLEPGLVILLPGPNGQGINVCLSMPKDQMEEFSRFMKE